MADNVVSKHFLSEKKIALIGIIVTIASILITLLIYFLPSKPTTDKTPLIQQAPHQVSGDNSFNISVGGNVSGDVVTGNVIQGDYVGGDVVQGDKHVTQ